MTTVDELLIEQVFSPFSGWLKHHFGICQWRASIFCLDGSVAFYLAGVALTIGAKGMADGIFVDLLTALAWLGIMSFVRSVAFRQAGSSMGVQTARLQEWLFRTAFMALLPLSILQVRGLGNFCYTVSLLLLVLHLYFKASDTPPPEQRRKLAFARGGA